MASFRISRKGKIIYLVLCFFVFYVSVPTSRSTHESRSSLACLSAPANNTTPSGLVMRLFHEYGLVGVLGPGNFPVAENLARGDVGRRVYQEGNTDRVEIGARSGVLRLFARPLRANYGLQTLSGLPHGGLCCGPQGICSHMLYTA